MNPSRSAVLALAVPLALAGCAVARHAPAALGAAPDPANRSVADYLDRTLPRGTGGTVAAARGGELAHCRGFGLADHAARTPAGCDTVYDVMSLTKQFTAAAILKLEMMGRLRVGDPIGRFVGPVPGDKRAITLHHLLTHTAGLPETLGGDYAVMSRDAMLRGAMKAKLRSAPGTEHFYSNLGYSVLAAVVEKASGLGYERFLAEHLFAPAGMRSTGYVLPRWRPHQVAVEYDDRGNGQGRPYDHPWAADGPYWNLRGNGGLLSTPRDMFRWHRALAGTGVLSENAKRKLFAPHVPDGDGAFYGYGWTIVDNGTERIAWHNGGNGWSMAVFARSLRDGTMVYWSTNQVRRKGGWDLADLEGTLTQEVAARVRRPPANRRTP
ncbi:serine hydrolase domain-containing protein [Actinomadura kijaniata]|uniref:serine hydrolase domain-containing protein n=1 Tax=Actinomadura kijaniata TaxID=46161 RepID=UPI003F1AC141